MVTLSVPPLGSNQYFIFEGAIFGPSDLSLKTVREPVKFNSKLNAFKQSRGLFNENNVTHDKFEGNLVYNPLNECGIPNPTRDNPHQMRYPLDRLLYAPRWENVPLGVAEHNVTKIHYFGTGSLGGTFYTTWWEDKTRPGYWKIRRTHSVNSKPGYIFSHVEWTFVGFTPRDKYGECGVQYVRVDYPIPFEGLKTVFSDDTYDGWTGGPRQPGDGALTRKTELYTGQCDVVFNPRTAREKIDVIVRDIFPTRNFPLEDVPYGNLAMSAASKMSVNNVNMLEFLYELKTPLSLLHKLGNLKNLPRNLKKIKKRTKDLKSLHGASDAYLATKYGILPTISELSEIVEALKGIKPYYDRNGFKTYSAGYQSEVRLDGVKYELQQHVKIAIENEDAEFKRLINQIESFGFLPNLENIWDLVTYSFVVDWFIDMGALMRRVDTHFRVARLNIQYVTQSRRTVISGNVTHASLQHPFTGSVKWVHYHRWVSDQCPVPPLSLKSTFQDFNHWLESSALIIQRTKRR